MATHMWKRSTFCDNCPEDLILLYISSHQCSFGLLKMKGLTIICTTFLVDGSSVPSLVIFLNLWICQDLCPVPSQLHVISCVWEDPLSTGRTDSTVLCKQHTHKTTYTHASMHYALAFMVTLSHAAKQHNTQQTLQMVPSKFWLLKVDVAKQKNLHTPGIETWSSFKLFFYHHWYGQTWFISLQLPVKTGGFA